MGQAAIDVVEEQCIHCVWWKDRCIHPEADDPDPVEDCALFDEDEEERLWAEYPC